MLKYLHLASKQVLNIATFNNDYCKGGTLFMTKETISYQELLNIVRSMRGKDELFYFFLRACENGNLQICQICLDAGADINICEHFYERTLLYRLVESGKLTTEVGDWLIEQGADINMTGLGDWTNLTLACYQGNFNIAKYFIDKGIKIKQYKDGKGGSDLYHAVHGENEKIVKMLLELGVDLESDINPAENPFILAIERKLPNIVELFLQKGASANFYAYGRTPLHKATQNKDVQTAKVLLEHDANVNAKLEESAGFIDDDFALTPMDIAVLNQDIDMQKLLSAFGGTISSKEEKILAITQCSDTSKERLLMIKKILES